MHGFHVRVPLRIVLPESPIIILNIDEDQGKLADSAGGIEDIDKVTSFDLPRTSALILLSLYPCKRVEPSQQLVVGQLIVDAHNGGDTL